MTPVVRRSIECSVALFCGLAAGLARAEAAPSAEQIAFFEQKIRPLLAESCYECHSAEAKANKKLKGGLYLDTREGWMHGGDTGPALTPGQPEKSLLIKAIGWGDLDLAMPPKKKLPDAAIADLTKWVQMGAPDPRVGGVVKAKRVINIAEGREHWAFKPLASATPPAVKNAAWVRTPIDQFILAKLEAAGIQPSAPAAREKLLRRAYFDLLGLPPTPDEIDAFVKDQSSQAFSTLVDRLLVSPRYGERWGRHWLDVVRYAESGGYEFDGFRPGAYHYRDWVIRSLNQDMPYDQFVRMQLAGDKLTPGEYDGAAATGFLVAGPYPGQTTAKTIERIRYDQLDDMISTIGGSMLGLTMGCVRCHDHKYDPLPQQDYYGIAAALSKTVQGDIKVDLQNAKTQAKLAAFEAELKPLREKAAAFEKAELPGRFESWRMTKLAGLKPGTNWQVFDVVSATATTAALESAGDGLVVYAANKVKDDLYTIKAVTFQKGVNEFRIDALADKALPAKGPGLSDNGNFVLADFKVIAKPLDPKSKVKPVTLKLTAGKATFEQKDYTLAKAVDADGSSGWAVAPQMGKDHAATFAIAGEPVGFDGGTEFEFQLRFTGFFGLGRMRLAFSNGEAPMALADSEEPQHLREIRAILQSGEGKVADPAKAHLLRWFARFDDGAGAVFAAVREQERKRPRPDLINVYTTQAGGQDVYLLRRGEVDNKAGKAAPSFIQVLSSAEPSRWTGKPGTDPRVELGNWLTDSECGAGQLLARVMANRVWKYHFGKGLVATPNDFGAQGEKPTHPELLDYLAGQLIKNGWRLKPLHQMIMSSAAYQQGMDANAKAQQVDPENKLWWHRPARRLEAEAIRDALLVAGGRLDEKMFGPSENTVESARRSVYLRVKRSELIPFLTLFDGPEPTQSIGDRGTTTVPTQALTLLNSPFVHDAAAKLATRALKDGHGAVDAAMDVAFRVALARVPAADERAKFVSYLHQQETMIASGAAKVTPAVTEKALAETCLVLLCTNEFVYVD